ARPGVKVRARRGYLALEPAALLRASGSTSTAVSPKPASDSARAKADPTASAVSPKLQSEEPGAKPVDIKTPEPPVVPISPGLLALPDNVSVTLPGEMPSITEKETASVTAVRARIDAGQMVLALGKSDRSPML